MVGKLTIQADIPIGKSTLRAALRLGSSSISQSVFRLSLKILSSLL